MPSADPLWIHTPTVLFSKAEVWPVKGMSLTARSNAAARLVILATAVVFVLAPRPSVLVTGIACLLALALMTRHLIREKEKKEVRTMMKEGFHGMDATAVGKVAWTRPSAKNPLMNVLLPEIKDNPLRPPAAPAYNPTVETDINDKTQEMVVQGFRNDAGIDTRLFRDLGDSLNFDRSMISFNATPNTQIPNDQKGFAEFCYGDMPSAKEGTPSALIANMKPRVIDGE